MISFTIPLQPVTKKNSLRIIKCGKFHKVAPSAQYAKYEKDARVFIPHQSAMIDYPVEVKAIFYMKTRRRVDLTNLLEALHDVMVKYGLLKDDNNQIIVSVDGSRVLYDKENPRTEVTIRRMEEFS